MDGLLLVSKAAAFAARSHAGQHRKGLAQEPYVNHLAEVALILAEGEVPAEPELLAAAWLHDTLEDTSVTREDLEDQFGPVVAAIVAEVTDDKRLPKAERKRLQVETVARKSDRARRLKVADKTSNVRALSESPPVGWDRARLIGYVDFAEAVVAGCRGLDGRLDHAFDRAAEATRLAILRAT